MILQVRSTQVRGAFFFWIFPLIQTIVLAAGGGAPRFKPSAVATTARVAVKVGEGSSPVRGAPRAPVTIIAFSDFTDPACRQLSVALAEVMKQYPKQVRIIFKQFPRSQRADARLAAEASLAAADQGRFWEMHDRLFAAQPDLNRQKIESIASGMGLDMVKFRKTLDANINSEVVEREIKEGETLGLTTCPAVFINGRYLGDATSFAMLKSVVEEEIRWAKSKNRPAFRLVATVQELPGFVSPTEPDPDKVYTIPIGKAPVRGPQDARVTIIQYADYQSPASGKAYETLKQVLQSYPRDVRLIFKHHPLGVNKSSRLAANAALAAGEQGKFWEMHDRLFNAKGAFDRQSIYRMATDLGLNMAKFNNALSKGTYQKQVEDETAECLRLGATRVPAFFINGRYVLGARPFEFFKQFIDREIARLTNKTSPFTVASAPATPTQPSTQTQPSSVTASQGSSPSTQTVTNTPPPPTLVGIEITGLDDRQKQVAERLIRSTQCFCYRNVSVYECRSRDKFCPFSFRIGTRIVEGVRANRPESRIVEDALTPEPFERVAFHVDIGSSPVRGAPNARVTIIEFSDFQCPFCRRASTTLNELLRLYPEDIRVVYKYYPLSFHANARPAAEAAAAAGEQGKFWEMYERIFSPGAKLTRDSLIQMATDLGLDVAAFTASLDSRAHKDIIDQDIATARKLGITSTPSFLLNGRFLKGAKHLEMFKILVEQELAWAKAGNRPDFRIGDNVREGLPPTSKR